MHKTVPIMPEYCTIPYPLLHQTVHTARHASQQGQETRSGVFRGFSRIGAKREQQTVIPARQHGPERRESPISGSCPTSRSERSDRELKHFLFLPAPHSPHGLQQPESLLSPPPGPCIGSLLDRGFFSPDCALYGGDVLLLQSAIAQISSHWMRLQVRLRSVLS